MSEEKKESPEKQQNNVDKKIEVEQSSNNSVEDLKAQLKAKNKENKVLTTKNSKLQAKYVELFRESKLLKKDYDTFLKVLEEVIPDFQKQQTGSYVADDLKKKWFDKQSKASEKIQQMIQEAAHEKRQLQKHIKEEMELKIQNKDEQSKNYLEGLNNELEGLKKSNKILSQQIVDIDKKLDSKNNEVSKLTKQKLKLEHIINQQKVKEISDELGETKKQSSDKSSTERNEFLALRQQVDSLMMKRDELRNQVKEGKSLIRSLQEELKEKTKKIKDFQSSIQKLQDQNTKLKTDLHSKFVNGTKQQEQKSSFLQKSPKRQQVGGEEQISHHFELDDEYVHREYIKNVFLRYMKCSRGGDIPQADILQNIILTILKFTVHQREQIKIKKRGWF